ncbi:MAG: hypothetical protein GY868_09740 [Deltaproteobacteria bacterium]|nr:hypothetical protein [Deltaproteobacteria bacterium]
MIKQGLTTGEIAAGMHVAVEIIKSHRRNIHKKMGLQNKKTNLRSALSKNK